MPLPGWFCSCANYVEFCKASDCIYPIREGRIITDIHRAQKAHMMHSENNKPECFPKFFVREEKLVEKWVKNYVINILKKEF